MARLTKAEKQVENAVDAAFKKHGSNVQFNIFDLSKISDAGRNAAKTGGDIEAAVIAAIAQYRQN